MLKFPRSYNREGVREMKRIAPVLLMLVIVAGPLFGAQTSKQVYPMPCGTLWPSVKDTVRNSGEYAVVFLDNTEMVASFSIGYGNGFRMGSAVLNPRADGCEMQLTTFSIALADDAGSFRKRLDASLSRLKSSPAAPAKTDGEAK